MDGSVFYAVIEALGFLVLGHQGDQHPDALPLAFGAQRVQQGLGDPVVPFAFQHADPIQIGAEAGRVASAADHRRVNSADHALVPQRNVRNRRVEARVLKAALQLLGVGFIRLPEIGIRLLPPDLPLKGKDLFHVLAFHFSDFKHVFWFPLCFTVAL